MSAVHDRWELVEPLLFFAHVLRDSSAFRTGETKLSRNKSLEVLRREHRLEDTAIAHAFSLLDDRARSTIDRDSSGDGPEGEPLYRALRETAKRWLVADGDHWTLRMDTRCPGHEIIRWRGVTMLVPPSIVVAAALSTTERSHPRWVQVLPDSIAPSEPIGHLHVHLGPMLPFETLWMQLWNAFLQRGTLDAPRSDGIASLKGTSVPEIGRLASKRQPGMRWQWILELAFAARVWLLLEGKRTLPSVLGAFSRGQIEHERRAGALLTLRSQKEWHDRARREARLSSESRMREDRRTRTLRSRALATDPPMTSADISADAPSDGDDEVVFLAEAFRRCHENASYAQVLYQYLRVKVALYSSLVVDPWTVGLGHFLDVVKRDDPYRNAIDDASFLDAARFNAVRTEKPLRVDALEIHIHPAGWLKQSRQTPHRHTWVLSFVRAKPAKDGDPGGARATEQWRRAIVEAAARCRQLARCMAMRPSVLRELRGIGLMDSERNGPVWMFETAFRRLIDASTEVAAGHPRLGLRPIHTAFHLGEDFDHVLSGLRQILEPLEWGLIHRGDRIGHALALGLSPEEWCEQYPWVRMRPWDRILDIGFACWAFDKLGLPLSAEQLERMRLDAGDAIRRIFADQDHDPLETARNLWLSLPRSPVAGANTNRYDPRAGHLAHARSLKARLLEDRSVGRKALALSLTVETRHDLGVIKAVRDIVHDRVAKWQVAIEVNPSSNLLIGGFRSIFRQPFFHTDDLPITLNADDPMTFATTLADEYAYAWVGMVIGSGQSPDQATQRLEQAARCSMRYVFAEPPDRKREKRE